MPKKVKECEGQTHFVEMEFECPMCHKQHSIMLFEQDALDYHTKRANGYHIQDIFPDMSPRDREKFLTGYCDDCQKMIFGE